jgi:hypothetical protein
MAVTLYRQVGKDVPVISPGVTGSVNVGQSFFILDVWQLSSRKVIWSASNNVGTSWSTHTGIANLVKGSVSIWRSRKSRPQNWTVSQRQALQIRKTSITDVSQVALNPNPAHSWMSAISQLAKNRI